MAQNLSFSVANILRSDFPHPSRITKKPKVFYMAPLRETRNVPFVALRCQLDQRASCSETGFFTYSSAPTIFSRPGKDVYQNSSQRREQKGKIPKETLTEGNFIFSTSRVFISVHLSASAHPFANAKLMRAL